MTDYIYRTCEPAEKDAVTELYFACREDLCLPNRDAAQKIAALLFTKGQLTGGYHNQELVGALGYFLGEPKHNYANNEVLYLYVGAILPAYRLTRLFHHGLLYTLERFQGTAVTDLRLQAEAANPYTNKLYGRFARPIAQENSPRGVPVITYGGPIETAIAYLSRWKRPRSSQTKGIPSPNQPFDHGMRMSAPPHNWEL